MPQIRLRIAVREFSDFENALAEEIDLYRASHPDVEFEPVPLDLHKLHAELFEKHGLRNGTWDIGYITTDWLAEAAEEGALEELTPYMQRKPVLDWPQGWARSIVDPLYFGDKLYCFPWHDGPECLIYRRDLLEDPKEQQAFRNKYGYELKPPVTWRQFGDIAHFFTRPEQNLYGTLFAAFPDGHNTLYDFALQLWSRGGEFEDKDGNALLDTREAISALDFYRNTICDASMCYPDAEKYDSTRSGDVFLSGQVAMMVNWFGFAARCDRPGSPLRGKVAIAPIPAEEGKPAASLSVFWTLGIGTGSKHKQAAYDFIHFLMQPELDLGIVKHGTVGVRLSTWRNHEVQKQAPAYSRIEEVSLGARRLPRSRNLPAFAGILNDVAMEALTTQTPSAEILKKAQRRITEMGINFR
ncbi:MAG TPA: extracellular solute-binding protein [Pseudacidobacterium sp.]|nr:extracellular solute-binding protein [Pseudacidobacterium sp.]